MARTGRPLLAFAALTAFVLARPLTADPPSVAGTLAVQDAMRRGRELLQRGQVREAVEALEDQLPHVNGVASSLRPGERFHSGMTSNRQVVADCCRPAAATPASPGKRE